LTAVAQRPAALLRISAAFLDGVTMFFVHVSWMALGAMIWDLFPQTVRTDFSTRTAIITLSIWAALGIIPSLLVVALPLSRYRTTLGKRWCGLEVAAEQKPLTARRAAGRTLATIGISLIGTLGSGFIMGLIREDGRCLHDLILGTKVVSRPGLSKQRKWLLGLAAVSMSFCLAAVGLEIGYRFYLAVSNPWVTLTPNGVAVRPESQSNYRGVPVTIDRRGCRTSSAPWNENDSERILVIGDSVAFGLGVSDDEVFTHLLNTGTTASYVNLGRPSWNTLDLRDLLYQRGSEFAPTELLWVYFINDATTSFDYKPPEIGSHPNAGFRRAEWAIYKVLRWPFLLKPVANHLLAGLHLRPDGPAGSTWEDHYAWCMDSYSEDNPKRSNEARYLQDVISWSRSQNCPLRVVIAPAEDQLTDGKTQPQEFVRQLFEAESVPVLDLLPILKDAQQSANKSLFIIGDHAHWNADGNQVVANAIARWMSQ